MSSGSSPIDGIKLSLKKYDSEKLRNLSKITQPAKGSTGGLNPSLYTLSTLSHSLFVSCVGPEKGIYS